jgi:hypothetical protein
MERVGPYVFQVCCQRSDPSGFRSFVTVRKGDHIIASHYFTVPAAIEGEEQAVQAAIFRAWQLCSTSKIARHGLALRPFGARECTA